MQVFKKMFLNLIQYLSTSQLVVYILFAICIACCSCYGNTAVSLVLDIWCYTFIVI